MRVSKKMEELINLQEGIMDVVLGIYRTFELLMPLFCVSIFILLVAPGADTILEQIGLIILLSSCFVATLTRTWTSSARYRVIK